MSARKRPVSGSVSTCQALTAASAPEDTHSTKMADAAKVSWVMHTHNELNSYKWGSLCLIFTVIMHTFPPSPPDINQCSRKNGGCSHLCVNQKGGYKCVCPASHRLSPYSWKKCVPRTTMNTAG